MSSEYTIRPCWLGFEQLDQQMFPHSDSLTGCSVLCPNVHCRLKLNNTGLNTRAHWRRMPLGSPEALGNLSCALPLFSWHAASLPLYPSWPQDRPWDQLSSHQRHTLSLCYANSECCAKSLKSCPTLCDPVVCSLPGSSVHGLLQARILEWVTMPFSRGSSQPRDWTHVSYISCIGRWVLYH